MIGRTPGYIVAVRPLRKGAITDFDITQRMIRLLLQRVGRQPVQPAAGRDLRAVGHHRGRAAGGHRGGPAGRRGRRAAHRAADGRGDRRRPADPRADRQHGRSTSAAAPPRPRSSRSAASSRSQAVRVGSFDIDAAIQTYVRREYGIAIGERTAEEIKVAIGSAWPIERRVQGRGARPRPHERPAQDGDPVARGGARGDRRAGVARSSTR